MIAVRLRIRQGTLNDPGLVCLGAADGGERRLPSGHAFELRGDRERLSAGGLREDDGVEGFLLDVEAASAGEDVLFPEESCVDQALAAEWGRLMRTARRAYRRSKCSSKKVAARRA